MFFNLRPSASAECENAALVIHWTQQSTPLKKEGQYIILILVEIIILLQKKNQPIVRHCHNNNQLLHAMIIPNHVHALSESELALILTLLQYFA